jgi:hypothetical protein
MSDDDIVLPATEPAAAETIAPEKVEKAETPRSVRDDVAEAFKTVHEPKPEAKEPEAGTEPPKAEPKTDATGRAHGQDGKFVAKDKPSDKPLEAKPIEAPAEIKGPQQAPAKITPPTSWSIPAKSKWDALPQEVRDAIAKREDEVSSGFRDYAALKPFAERAKQSGTTLANVLQSYTAIEDMLRSDQRAGFLQIAQNMRLTQHQAGQLFAHLAQQLGHQFQAPATQNGSGGSTGDQNPGADPNILRQMLDPVVGPLQQKLATLESAWAQQAEAAQRQRLQMTSSVIERFRQDPAHKYYDNLERIIGDLLESGMVQRTGDPSADLATAYEKACWDNPEIRELLINERMAKAREQQQAKTAAAKRAAVSITGAPQGAPAPGLNGSRGNVRDDVAAAFASLREQV